ncbi:MAG: hypothetical protein A3F72_11890 [Bacteroidetes bacterium RIFCSPLOWO2_12_FULL_35_15]|nr:MAG: hypothetical protein A3F72_11890 [Bacteroidetes bacterium RIFCSPLOWO2_12_FULL_35_15]
MDMNIRLEYSPIEGKFNQAQATDSINVAKGYRMLCCFVNAERALRFTQAIEIKYPELISGNDKPFPPFSTMKDELYHFFLEDIKLLEQHMNITYQRRKQLLNNQS